jgi:hypothetical protein
MKAGPEKGEAEAWQHSGRDLPKRANLKRSTRLPPVIVPTWDPCWVERCIITKSGMGNLRFVDFSEAGRAESMNLLTGNLL